MSVYEGDRAPACKKFEGMKVIKLWFHLTILFRLIWAAADFHEPPHLHTRIMASIRAGDVDGLLDVVVFQPQMIRKFNLTYWAMAMYTLRAVPESLNRQIILRILLNGLKNKNRGKYRYTPLIMATLSGNLFALRQALKVTKVNGLNKLGESALSIAVRDGKLSAALELINYGADVEISDRAGCNALHYATRLNNLTIRSEAISLLLSKGASVNFMEYFKYKIDRGSCDFIKCFDTNDVISEFNVDELLLRRLYLDFEEKITNFAILIAILMCAAFKSILK